MRTVDPKLGTGAGSAVPAAKATVARLTVAGSGALRARRMPVGSTLWDHRMVAPSVGLPASPGVDHRVAMVDSGALADRALAVGSGALVVDRASAVANVRLRPVAVGDVASLPRQVGAGDVVVVVVAADPTVVAGVDRMVVAAVVTTRPC